MSIMTIRKVEDQATHKDFFEFPWKHYKGDPHWTPTLLSMRAEKLDKKKNPSWEYLEGDYYVAYQDDTPVGTIAAFVNHEHNRHWNENIAWFGMFECIDSQPVADALLNTALAWAREHGYDALRGPQSFTDMDEVGIQVAGFERPVMLMAYNYPYYQVLVENAGFEKVMDVHSFHLSMSLTSGAEIIDRMKRIVQRKLKNTHVYVRPGSRKTSKADFKVFQDLYNVSWSDNWDFTPLTERELNALVKSLSQFYDPRLACFLELDGKPVGFLLAVPDFNQILKAAYPKPGELELWSMVKALWHWKIRPKITWSRLALMGVLPEYRNMGLDVLMYDYLYTKLCELGYEHLDCGWILETNTNITQLLEKAGMDRYKTHRFYEKKV